jgi:hypothetical protein
MIELILLLTIICSAIMDAITSQDSFAKYGLWFSREGYVLKYDLEAWLNKFLPSSISKFLAYDVLVIFTDLFHLSKTIMVACFIIAIFGFTIKAFLAYFVWGLVFSAIYYIIR